MKKILLIGVANDHGLSGLTYEGIPRLMQKKAFIMPLSLATVAALTPDDFEVRIWDEYIHGLIDDTTNFAGYDLVGITAFTSNMLRARKIARIVRAAGITVVIGGPGASSAPEDCGDDFDALFIGEAETTWPQYLADVSAGRPTLREYRATTLPEMSLSPPPRWDSIADRVPAYLTGGVQVSRGCPFNCEFCGVWQIFGRTMRTKPIDQVIEEVRTLERLGMKSILFCSDNFSGDPKYAIELLRRIIELNSGLAWPLSFAAELDITIARNDEMLALLADANFSGLLIGIETPNLASLAEARKRQNLRGSLIDSCRHIQSYGIPIDASIIVGFDNDTTATFDEVFAFLQEACIPLPKMHMLKAIVGTELHQRLSAEGRVIDETFSQGGDMAEYLDPVAHTNIVPKGMTRIELLAGYQDLIKRVFAWENFEQRLTGFMAGIQRKPGLSVKLSGGNQAAGLRSRLDSFPANLRPSVERLLTHTEETMPFMLPAMVQLLFRHTFAAARVPVICSEIERQIERERQQVWEIAS